MNRSRETISRGSHSRERRAIGQWRDADVSDYASAAAAIAARIDRLPMSWPLWALVLLVACGGWFEIYDMFFTAYVGPGLVKSHIFTTTTVGFFGLSGLGAFIAAMFAGLFVGTFFFGQLADRFGRRPVFTSGMVWYSAAAVLLAFQHNAAWIILFRLLTGIGVGAQIAAIDSYVAELVPANSRGRAFASYQALQFTAVPTVALLGWYFVPRAPFGLEGWRWVILLGSLGALVVWFIRRALPESPRWLAQKGRVAEADAIVTRIEEEIVARTGASLPTPQRRAPIDQGSKVGFLELWHSRYRGHTVMMMVFNFFQSIGYYGFASWVPTLLIAKGISLPNSFEYSFLIAIASPVGPLLSISFADRIDRKWTVVGASIAMVTIGLLLSRQVSSLALVILGVAMALAGGCLTFSYRAYQAELFPTRLRGRAIGTVYSVSRISAMLSGFLTAFCLRNYGVTGAFMLIVGSMLVVVTTIGAFGPCTTGLELDASVG